MDLHIQDPESLKAANISPVPETHVDIVDDEVAVDDSQEDIDVTEESAAAVVEEEENGHSELLDDGVCGTNDNQDTVPMQQEADGEADSERFVEGEESAPRNEEDAEDQDTEQSEKATNNKLPLSKIKNIMKLDPDVTICSADAAFLITRATEHFIRFLSDESFKSTKTTSRKTVQKKDVDDALAGVDQFLFLDGAL